jgi:hypothetical protein
MGKQLKTVNIHGKQYVEVKERLKYFRENFKGWSLVSEIFDLSHSSVIQFEGTDRKKEATVTIIAKIIDPEGNVRATGMAQEAENSSHINKGSHVENCETSAWGRALANLGIGIDNEVASADEVNKNLNAKK